MKVKISLYTYVVFRISRKRKHNKSRAFAKHLPDFVESSIGEKTERAREKEKPQKFNEERSEKERNNY